MILLAALFGLLPALITWLVTERLGAVLAVWIFVAAQSVVWFFWATAAPPIMVIQMEFFTLCASYSTWHSFGSPPKPKKLLKLNVRQQPLGGSPHNVSASKGTSVKKLARAMPVTFTLAVFVTAGYLLIAWCSGVPTFVQSPFVQTLNRENRKTLPRSYGRQVQTNPPKSVDVDNLENWNRTVKP